MFGWPSAFTKRSLWLNGVAGSAGKGIGSPSADLRLIPDRTRGGTRTSAAAQSSVSDTMPQRTEFSAAAWPSAVSSLANCPGDLPHRVPSEPLRPLGGIERHVLEQIGVKRRQQPLECPRD